VATYSSMPCRLALPQGTSWCVCVHEGDRGKRTHGSLRAWSPHRVYLERAYLPSWPPGSCYRLANVACIRGAGVIVCG
jgi:hypothetical protein